MRIAFGSARSPAPPVFEVYALQYATSPAFAASSLGGGVARSE